MMSLVLVESGINMTTKTSKPLTFVDAFAGCGGLSLGLLQAGLRGLFAIEHDSFAFASLKANLISRSAHHRFSWPRWLPRQAMSIETLIKKHRPQLKAMAGKVDVLAGGPPCQGFSSAGRRKYDDPRNQLFAQYLELVDLLRPRFLLIENVRGFTVDFQRKSKVENYAAKLRQLLSDKYDVYDELLDLSKFGVPQLRTRYFLVAAVPGLCVENPFETLRKRLPNYLRSLGLRAPVSSWAALSDLEIGRGGNTRFRPALTSKFSLRAW